MENQEKELPVTVKPTIKHVDNSSRLANEKMWATLAKI